jgi:hypothetical protein
MRSIRFLYVVAAVCLCISTGGADTSFCVQGGKVISVDTSPGNLEVTIEVDDRAEPAEGEIAVHMRFDTPQGSVDFQSGETVTCNEVALSYDGPRGYSGLVPQVAPGDNYTFVYTRDGKPAKIIVPALQRPVLTNPTVGAAVQRSSSLNISYVAAQGDSICVRADDGIMQTEGLPQADSGTYTQLNVSRLKSGPGSIELTRTVRGTPPRNGFKSVLSKYQVSSSIDINWL